MRRIDYASFEEYVIWYLQRDSWKRGRNDPPRIEDIDWCLREMYMEHSHRVQPAFALAKWTRVVCDSLEIACSWLAPPFKWLEEEGLYNGVDRSLGAIADQALAMDFFNSPRIDAPRSSSMYAYYRMLQDEQLRFSGVNRIVLWQDTQANTIELFDGIGRVLPMVVLAKQGGRMIPIEAYLGEV
ncbi:MAG: hypothetical protein OEM52_04120 [bacterium]|nr:hypothetical protein [bacterium]